MPHPVGRQRAGFVENPGRDSELCKTILAGCDEEQVTAITTEAMPLRVVAGAGSGKTRVITRRIAWRIATGKAAAGHVLAITFTRKAAGELRGRLAALRAPGVTTATFHGAAFAQLRQVAADAGRRPPAILDSKTRLIRQILRESWGDRRAADDDELVRALAAEIEWAKARVVTPADYSFEARAVGRRTSLAAPDVGALFGLYEKTLERKGLVDFEGLLAELARLIEQSSTLAAAQRWRFRHLFVDEFQDVNAAQLRLLEAWRGTSTDVCVVGDPDQSIYGWNGSDPEIMNTLDRRWQGVTTLHLSTNYRSTPEVISAAAAALALTSRRAAGSATGTAPRNTIISSRPGGPAPTITAFASDRAEADGVAAALRTAHRPGRSWRQLAVLARTNSQLLAFQQACGRRDIPCRLASGPFLDRPAVRKVLTTLGKAGNAADLDRFAADLEQAIVSGEVPDATAEDMVDLAALAGVCKEYLVLDPAATVAGFVSWARMYGREQPHAHGGADMVELTTFHRAKGLQWQVVFVTGLEDGLVPIGADRDDRSEAEERRLLYVALTRAEDELHCSWAAERRFGTRPSRREPSPYLRAIESALAPAAGVHVTTTVGRMDATLGLTGSVGDSSSLTGRVAMLRRTAAGDAAGQRADERSAPESPLMTAMREWRAVTARAARVPAYVVMPDQTLEAIATARPSSVPGLLDIPGIGPSRAALYGEKLLALVAESGPDDVRER